MLEQASKETSRLQVIPAKAGQSRRAIPIRTLVKSKHVVWLDAENAKVISERSFYRFCASFGANFKKGREWIGMCDICELYRRKAHPNLQQAVYDAVAALISIPGCEHYFDGVPVDQEPDADLLRSMLQLLGDEKRTLRDSLGTKEALRLHAAEAEAAHELRKFLRLHELFEHHKEAAERQHFSWMDLLGRIPFVMIRARSDFKQNNTIPPCLRETQKMWFARARR